MMNGPQPQHQLLVVEKVKCDDNAENKTSSDSGNRPQQQQQHIPLDWTRVPRRRKSSNDNSIQGDMNVAVKKKRSRILGNDETDDEEKDCTDLNCRRCISRDVLWNDSPSTDDSFNRNMRQISRNGDANNFLTGHIIFCLPDQDCEWFQGYFFPLVNDDFDFKHIPLNNSPIYGVLCTVKQDIDECLQCTAGGYREISNLQMTRLKDKISIKTVRTSSQSDQPRIHPRKMTSIETKDEVNDNGDADTTFTASTNHEPLTYPKRINVSNVTWVGGDMMSLYKTLNSTNSSSITSTTTKPKDINDMIPPTMSVLRMQTRTLYTGSDQVAPYVQRYFPTFLRYMLDSQNAIDCGGTTKNDIIVPQQVSLTNDNYKQVIELLMPDVAIVVGTMHLRVTLP